MSTNKAQRHKNQKGFQKSKQNDEITIETSKPKTQNGTHNLRKNPDRIMKMDSKILQKQ